MDEDTDSSSWVLVEKDGCEYRVDSDQESEGSSISIISERPTDSYSEEEHEPLVENETQKVSSSSLKHSTLSLLQSDSPGSNKSELSLKLEENRDLAVEVMSSVFEHPHIGEEVAYSETNKNIIETESVLSQSKPEDIKVQVSEVKPHIILEDTDVELIPDKNEIHTSPLTIENLAQTKQMPKQSESHDSEMESFSIAEHSHLKEALEEDDTGISPQAPDGDVYSTSHLLLNKVKPLVDDKAKLEATNENLCYLECCQEPAVVEDLSNDAEVETVSSVCAIKQPCQTVLKKEEQDPIISNKDPPRDINFNRIGIGVLISVIILITSHLFQQYSDYQQDNEIRRSSERFLEGLADSEKAKVVIDFCLDRHKAKGEYSEHAVEKCVIKRLKKKNREEAIMNTEIYLQMKERNLAQKEKELAEKEKEILRKWKKKRFSGENLDMLNDNKRIHSPERKKKDKNDRIFKKSDKSCKRAAFKEKRRGDSQTGYLENNEKNYQDDVKLNSKPFHVENYDSSDRKFKKYTERKFFNYKKKIKSNEGEKDDLINIKNKVKKSFLKNNIQQAIDDLKRENPEDLNEEWYIKYNPVKNTIKLINITTLPAQDSSLIRNGNKTINGQWYFSLYGSSRSNFRNNEKAAEWYFKRGHLREVKRDKAKWYFEYMSARDDNRYSY